MLPPEEMAVMVALRTPITFWICRTRLSAVASSASISHAIRHTPGTPRESTAKSRIGWLRRRKMPHAGPSVSRSLFSCTVTVRRVALMLAPPRVARTASRPGRSSGRRWLPARSPARPMPAPVFRWPDATRLRPGSRGRHATPGYRRRRRASHNRTPDRRARIAATMKELLPLPHHAEVAVVEDRELYLEPFLHHGGDLGHV